MSFLETGLLRRLFWTWYRFEEDLQQREAQVEKMKEALETEQAQWRRIRNIMRAEVERTGSQKDQTLNSEDVQSLHFLTSGPSGSAMPPTTRREEEEETPGEKANTTDSVRIEDPISASDLAKDDGDYRRDDRDAPADAEVEEVVPQDAGDLMLGAPREIMTVDAKKKRTRLDEEDAEPHAKTGSDSPKARRHLTVTSKDANTCFVSCIRSVVRGYDDEEMRRCMEWEVAFLCRR